MTKLLISVFKSPCKDEMYLYVEKKDQLAKVPEALNKAFGPAKHVMDMLLTNNRELARADSAKVISDIQNNGFYLQMPPAQDDYMMHLPEELLSFNDPV